MPYTAAFPKALGTGIVIQSELPIDTQLMGKLNAFIEHYEAVLSRFRNDSLVTAMSHAVHGGAFEFPQWALPLFELYDRLVALSDGAIDPCIGEDLIRLGYGADMRFTVEPDAAQHLGSLHGRPTWQGDVERHGTTLITHKAVSLDFGACGKGYLVDLLISLIDGSYGDDFNVAHCTDSTDNADTANVVDKTGINKLSHCDPNDCDSSDRKSMPPDDSSSWPKPISTANPLPRIILAAMSHADPTPHTNPASHGSSANETSYYTADDNDAHLGDISPSEGLSPLSSPSRQTLSQLVIDAGGDLYIRSDDPIAIALENPWNTDEAVGSAQIARGSFCASAPSRRNWGTMHRLHHLLNAIDGLPVNDVEASWVSVNLEKAHDNSQSGQPHNRHALHHQTSNSHEQDREPHNRRSQDDLSGIEQNQCPTATADGIATALFVCDPAKLASAFGFDCAVLYADGRAAMSKGFPGEFFTERRE